MTPDTAPPARLGVLACAHFLPEVQAAIAAEGWADVDCAALPPRCGRPPLAWEEIAAAAPPGASALCVIGSVCLHGLGTPPPGLPPARLHAQPQCFALLAGSTQVGQALEQHAYLLSPGWLRRWPEELARLGFAPDAAGETFREFARELLLLDSGVEPHSAARLAELSAALGLPARTLPVGLDHVRAQLRAWVLEWRLEQAVQEAVQEAGEQRRAQARALADHASALDLLARLTRQAQESQVLAGMEELFRMLFAPSLYRYLPDAQAARAAGVEPPPHDARHAWNAARSGFVLRLQRGTQALGLVQLEDFGFPEFAGQYLNLALGLLDVCALSLDNARTAKRLLEAEKMGALGALVAGIAHEINTPVGVGALAASTLQHQTRALAAQFAQRSMTQASLQAYLDEAGASTALVASSLERIGKLIASFRRVAVASQRAGPQRIALAASLRDAAAAFGERLHKGPWQLHIDCPEDLCLMGQPGDLESVFTNLIANSLQHGFKGRSAGCISIGARAIDSGVQLRYADDGCGLGEEGSRRVFEPFYTTDMQAGMGLGMHLVYNLVTQALGGSIRVDPHVAQGVRFLIELPAPAGAAASP